MEFSMEWNVICRVCLQEGQMRSIYEKDEKDVSICDKILKCSNITIKRGMNLPEQICSKCMEDLNIAYKFRTNCESSDAILQSLIEGHLVTDLIMSSETGEIYKYKPPQGLNVKRIRPVKIKYETPEEGEPNKVMQQDEVQNALAMNEESMSSVEEDGFLQEDTVEDVKDEEPSITETIIEPPEKEILQEQEENTESFVRDNNEQQMASEFEISEVGKVCTIKPVKTNKARSKNSAPKEKLRYVEPTEITTKPDGTTVIRVRRNVEEPKPLKICEICGNTYKYKHALESHMRRHRNEKPFSCEICGRSFVINFELRRHMRTHTGQKPYACRFCGRRFSDFGSRIKHERTHTGERPYTCETCGKSFAYSHVLSSHILTHTGEKRFGCTECGKRFAKSHHLKAHMNTHMKNQNKSVLVKTSQAVATVEEPAENAIMYQSDERVYQEVMNVLTAQPKIENFVDDEDIKVMYTTTTGETTCDQLH